MVKLCRNQTSGLDVIQLLMQRILFSIHTSVTICAGNTFQDLLRLLENADNNEHYIQRDIRVTHIHMLKFCKLRTVRHYQC